MELWWLAENMNFTRAIVFLLGLFILGSCTAPSSEVVVLGMIHRGHRESEAYSTEVLAEWIRKIEPDYVLTEIPPDRLATAQQQFAATGEITESRVRVFPEYVDVLFPLTREMDFVIVACAGWTREMADERRAKLAEWRETRAQESEEVAEAQRLAGERIETGGGSDNPRWIHTDTYDQHVMVGMEPYDRYFNEDLGLGGWTNINQAHYDLIEAAIETYGKPGVRFLITFGSWHKYWFLEQLRLRSDVVLVGPVQFLE